MSNQLTLLYEAKQKDQVFDYLQSLFGSSSSGVSVESLVENGLAQLSWSTDLPDHQIASKLTEQFPSLVIETPSTTGIDLSSRYFNGSQLW